MGSGDDLSGTQIAGAASADAAVADGGCDMARQVQDALRTDPLVQAAVAGLGGRVIRVWDGDWVKSQGEDGKGLAAVREAIMWQIAFAPKACRAQAVRGLILVSTRPGAASPRQAIGLQAWRWSDLLNPQRRVTAD